MKIKEFSEINPSPSCPIQGRHIINYIDTSSVIEGRLYDIQQLVKTFPSRAQREIRTQDILISSVRPNLKHNYFVEENANGMIASSGFIHIRVKDSIKISPRFLYYYLTSPSQVNRYIKIADSSQSAYPSFNKDIIEEIEFPNIDLPTQLRIAAILGSIDEKIELNRKKIAELEALAKTIYDYWFVQFDFPDKNGKPYKSSGGKMVWNEQLKREIPYGWEVKRLPGLAEYLFGYPFDSSLFNNTNIGFPIVRIRNVKDGITQDRTTEATNKDYIISNGDFLIGMDGYFDMNHWTGGDAYLVQRTCRIKAKEILYNGWLSLALYAPIKHLEKSLSGATLAHLGKLHLDEILLTLPPKNITDAALILINTTIQRKVSLGIEIQKLAKQRDTLLPLLMNGQVEVK